MSRTALRILLVVLACIPLASGTAGLVLGPGSLPNAGGAVITPDIDSEYRFVNVFWLAAGVLLIWSTLDLERRRAVTRLVLALAMLGGLARLVSFAAVGAPSAVFLPVIALELVAVPLVLLWHARAVPAGERRSERR